MRKIAFKPALTDLEQRVVLSTNLASPRIARAEVSSTTSRWSTNLTSQAKLNGTLTGRYTVENGDGTDAGSTYTLTNLKGKVGTLGQSKAVGTLYSLGVIDKGRAPGVLNISLNKGGTLLLALKGPEQVGDSPLPKSFRYTIAGGTGAAANLNGTGTLTVKLTPKGLATLTIKADSSHA